MWQEEVNLQTLTDNEDIQIGYSDNDIVIIDSIQKFAEVGAAHVSMSAIVICVNGKVQGQMNGTLIEVCKNQVAVIPPNVTITDLMISPDFNLKGMFLTNTILRSFLREKMNVWDEMMYIHRMHVMTLRNDDELLFYTHFYEMLRLCIDSHTDNPYRTEVIQALLRSAILALCGAMRQLLPAEVPGREMGSAGGHFQRFLDLLHDSEMKRRTVEWYANELCISPKYLSTICKKHSGKTANEWITEHVMEDIRYYLKQTDFSIKQICSQLGFPNTSFFGKYVKEHFGCTPTQLRQQ